jgi:mono/diheme cytochrome c family protein
MAETRLIRGVCSLLALALPVTSTLAADADNGARLASRWCATCHVVTPGQQGATTEAPPFAAIARRPDFSESKLAFFLLDPHPKMPDMGLSRGAAEDLAAYIAKLK